MSIKIIGKQLKLYRTVCTDENCLNILEFDSSDIKLQRISCMGRSAGIRKGISCPSCSQIITPEHFTEIQERTNCEEILAKSC